MQNQSYVNSQAPSFIQSCDSQNMQQLLHFDKENNNPYSIGRVSVDQSNENIDEFIASLATKKAILKIGKE